MTRYRVERAILSVLVLGSALASQAADPPSAPAADDDRTELVWCSNEKRSLVTRRARWRCEGHIVNAEEAQRIKQERVERIKRVLRREQEPLLPGKRLRGSGTGFFISRDGLVLTNNHVVDDCKAVTVTPAGGETMVGTLRGVDPARDLALLETRRSWPRAAVFRKFDEQFASGPVTMVGYPNHGMVVIKPVLVSGYLNIDSQPANPNVFVLNIDMRRGNSGGPVLDDAARVMGVVYAKVDTPTVFEKTGKVIRNVGLAIRLHVVRDFLRAHAVDVARSGKAEVLEAGARFRRAREFIAQIGCWR